MLGSLSLAAGGSGRGRRCRLILVADDEPRMVRLIQVNLERYGYEVIASDTLRGAVEATRRHDPDFLILDAGTPEPNGYEIMRQVRENSESSDVPVLILWAKSADVHPVDGEFEPRADYYLQKPFNPAELVRIVAGR